MPDISILLTAKPFHRKPNSSIARDVPLPDLQWPISERRELFQRTGNVQRQPFGVAFSRVDTHEGR